MQILTMTTSEVYIPNQEIAGEFEIVVEEDGWTRNTNVSYKEEKERK